MPRNTHYPHTPPTPPHLYTHTHTIQPSLDCSPVGSPSLARTKGLAPSEDQGNLLAPIHYFVIISPNVANWLW